MDLTFDPKVVVVADSISPKGIRLPTISWRHPRMIHPDFLTHRKFGRNGRSSRAVPVVTLLEEAKNPYAPHYMKNRPGMMASEEFTPEEYAEIDAIWRDMAEYTRLGVEKLNQQGLHKQWANRPLEWFGYIDVLVSATDWANFFALRDHEAAQPELQMVAQAVKAALEASTPKLLQPGDWHLPYITGDDWEAAWELHGKRQNGVRMTTPEQLDLLKKISAARCARITFKPFDGDGSIEAELKRYARLVEDRPVHASPVEHQATPDTQSYQKVIRQVHSAGLPRWETVKEGLDWDHPELHGNFTGWIQNRKTVPYEAVLDR